MYTKVRRLTIALLILSAPICADFNKNIITDYGGVCDGTTDDFSAFQAFKTAAIAWQVTHPNDNVTLTIPSATITGASNTSPIVVQAVNSFSNGQTVSITGVRGNEGANNTATNMGWVISSVSGTQFTLNGSVGTGTYTSGGGASRYKCVIGNTFFDGVVNTATLNAYGVWLVDGNSGYSFMLGQSSSLRLDNLHSARIATANAGVSSITLLDPSKTSLFTVGQWAVVTSLDMQGEGYPPNPAFWDFVLPTAIDSMTGVITLTSPLTHTHKSTYPLYNPGTAFYVDEGGPATIYFLEPKWNSNLVFNGIIIDHDSQTYAIAKTTVYNDIIVSPQTDTFSCVLPSLTLSWTLNHSSLACTMEVDKMIETAEITDTIDTCCGLFFQSAGTKNFNVTRSTFASGMVGSPINLTAVDSTFSGTFSPGAILNGASRSINCTNCVLPAIGLNGALDRGGPMNIGMENFYTMSGGVITSANANGPLPWAVPGAHLYWYGQSSPAENAGVPTTITDVTQDATNTYVHTSLSGGFPSIPIGVGLAIRMQPNLIWNCSNCTGSADAIDLSQAGAQGKPLFSYSKRTYTNNIGTGAAVRIWGSIISASMNVTTAYTGVQGTLALNTFGQFGRSIIKADGTAANYDPVINLKTVGNRVITPSGVTGTQTGDSGLTLPGPGDWLSNNMFVYLGTDIGGESGVGPTVTIEVITNQSQLSGYSLDGKVNHGGKVVIQ